MCYNKREFRLKNSWLTGKGFVSFIGIESSGGGKEDGGVEVSDDAGHGVGRVLEGVGSSTGSVQGRQNVGALKN